MSGVESKVYYISNSLYSNVFDGQLKAETIVSCLKLYAKNFQNLDLIMRNKLLAQSNQTINLKDFSQLMDILCYQTKTRKLVPKKTRYSKLEWLQVFKGFINLFNIFIKQIEILIL